MFKKVIVWGYPLYSHTQSYVQSGWYNAFQRLGYETYWFNDGQYPNSNSFDYKDCLFLTEGYADNNIPLEKSSTYFVHMCRNPGKYVEAGARLIDNRFLLNVADDWVYSYTLDRSKLERINHCLYEKNANDNSLCENLRRGINNYEAFYCFWATDLFPDEIDLDSIYLPRDNCVYYIGTIMDYNREAIDRFVESLKKYNIDFFHSNPWQSPKTTQECKALIQKSYIAPDIRSSTSLPTHICTNHKITGYISCRIFKNISYGQLGATNSKAIYDLFDGDIIYSDDESQLTELNINNRKNYAMIKRQMINVKENHTYLNRAKDLITIL